MKTVEKRYFVCETCGRTSLNEEKILACQASHRHIIEGCQIQVLFNKGGIFPHEINISWADGAVANYILNFTEKAPEKPGTEKEMSK